MHIPVPSLGAAAGTYTAPAVHAPAAAKPPRLRALAVAPPTPRTPRSSLQRTPRASWPHHHRRVPAVPSLQLTSHACVHSHCCSALLAPLLCACVRTDPYARPPVYCIVACIDLQLQQRTYVRACVRRSAALACAAAATCVCDGPCVHACRYVHVRTGLLAVMHGRLLMHGGTPMMLYREHAPIDARSVAHTQSRRTERETRLTLRHISIHRWTSDRRTHACRVQQPAS